MQKIIISNISTTMSIKKNSDCQYVINIYTTATRLFYVATSPHTKQCI